MAARDKEGKQLTWLIRHDRPTTITTLAKLVEDAKKDSTLDDATVVLAPHGVDPLPRTS
jgi:hypothetical protein